MSDAPSLPPKMDVALALLEGPSMFVHLDPRRQGVTVPQWLKKQAQLVLQVGMNMAVPIPDLDVGGEGLSCTLSFNRAPFWCDVPWTAVFALVGEDGRGMIWPQDVPTELATQGSKPPLRVVSQKKTRKRARARKVMPDAPRRAAVLNEVPDADPASAGTAGEAPRDAVSLGSSPDGSEGAARDGAGKTRALPPYLRVVK